MTDTPKLTKADLQQFTGTEHWYRHSLNRNISYTDGAKFVAERAGAYWLLDEIALAQVSNARILADELFQSWTLTVKDGRGVLSCEDGNGRLLLTEVIPFTDFPLDSITLYCIGGTVLLPSEY